MTSLRPQNLLFITMTIIGGFACGDAEQKVDCGDDLLCQYLYDSDFRRQTLEQSIIDPSNGYSSLRLANYESGDGWETLPVRNDASRPITVDELASDDDTAFTTFDLDTIPETDAEWLALGELAFRTFPLRRDQLLDGSIVDPDAAGLWIDSTGTLGGVLEVKGETDNHYSMTCSTCHGSVVDGSFVAGRSNAKIDRDKMVQLAYGGELNERSGPGRMDVTPDDIANPTSITDLRAIRYQRRLHWAGTLNNSLPALAVRIETLLITSYGARARPPRVISAALAAYLWSLGEEPPEPPNGGEGREIFDAQCASCHFDDGFAGEPIALSVIGTDRAVGDSLMRGTGVYRVPSLYKVGSRPQFLHDASVATLDELFDEQRLESVPGHRFGLDLSPQERQSLISFLESM